MNRLILNENEVHCAVLFVNSLGQLDLGLFKKEEDEWTAINLSPNFGKTKADYFDCDDEGTWLMENQLNDDMRQAFNILSAIWFAEHSFSKMPPVFQQQLNEAFSSDLKQLETECNDMEETFISIKGEPK